MNSTALILSLLPLLVLAVAIIVIIKKSQKTHDGRRVIETAATPKNSLFAAGMWLFIAVINFALEAYKHSQSQSATFQAIMGTFAVAIGCYNLGIWSVLNRRQPKD